MFKFLPLIIGNLARKKLRSGLTLFSILIAFVLFGVLAAAWHGFASGIKSGSSELVVFSQNSRFHRLPLGDKGSISTIRGVRKVSYFIWFGGYFRDPKNQLSGLAVDTSNYFAVDQTLRVPPEQLAVWQQDRTGVVVGTAVAQRYGWKIGDQIPVKTALWRNSSGGDFWTFTVDGIGQSAVQGLPADDFLLHYDYLNQSAPPGIRNTVSAFLVRIGNPNEAALISSEIDGLFINSPAPTRTNTTTAVAQGFADQFANLGKIVLAIATAVFISLLLITANVHAHSVRERLAEWATMRALGYTKTRIVTFVTGEALAVMIIGAAIGLGIAKLLTPFLSRIVVAFLPGFFLPTEDIALGILLAVVMAFATAAIPGVQVTRLAVAAALRRG